MESTVWLGFNEAKIVLVDYVVDAKSSALCLAASRNCVHCIRIIIQKVQGKGFSDALLLSGLRTALRHATSCGPGKGNDLLLTPVPYFLDANSNDDKDALAGAMHRFLRGDDWDDRYLPWPHNEDYLLRTLRKLVSVGAVVDPRAFWAYESDCTVLHNILPFLDLSLLVESTYKDDDMEYDRLHEARPTLFVLINNADDDPSVIETFFAAGACATTTDENLSIPLHLIAHQDSQRYCSNTAQMQTLGSIKAKRPSTQRVCK